MPRFALLSRASLPIAASWLAVGGVVGPTSARPQVPTPPQFRFVAGPAQAQTLADSPWFAVFDDPLLQALIRDAIASNLDLQIAAARVQEARAQAGIAKSFFYPQIDATANTGLRQASTTKDQAGVPLDDTTHASANYGFQLSWEIDLFGRLRRQHEAALALALASEQGRRGVLVTLVGDVATNYFLLRELDLQLYIARETPRVNNETVRYFQNRLAGGVSNRLELDRIQANRALTAASIPDIEQQIALVENATSLLLGRPPAPVERERLLDTGPLPPSIPPGLPVSLIERLPNVLEAEQLLVASNPYVGAARALF